MVESYVSANGMDLVDAVRDVLEHSPEPLTVPRIRERLPAPFRRVRIEDLGEVLQRQVAAHVLVMCPKYRSRQDRYWNRSLHAHANVILHAALQGGPMSWTDLRKRFPKYLRHLADLVLNEELDRGTVFRHPPTSTHMGPRYALQPADVRTYAGKALHDVLTRLEQCGFARADAREALMEVLQQEDWADAALVAARDDWWEKTMS